MFNRQKDRLLTALRGALMRAMALCPIQKNKVVFSSFSGKAFSDNPKAVAEALRELCPDADIVWLFSNPDAKSALLTEHARAARSHSLRGIFELATAKVWVDNMPKPLYTKKRKHQFYMQTWHGDRGFKKMLYDAPDHTPGKPVLEQHIADIMTSGSTFCEGTYRTGFRYPGEILKVGSPRNDLLMHPDPTAAAAIKATLGLSPSDKVLLYAPTMRNAPRRQGIKQPIQPIDLLATLDALERRFSGTFRCVVRAHSTQKGLSGLPESERIIDASTHEDMAELLLIADMLITDYSSCAGDFALTGRPIVLFQEDREGFARDERTFYFDIGQSPYVVAASQRELMDHIESLSADSARSNDEAILRYYGAYESGHAARSAAEWIAERLR